MLVLYRLARVPVGYLFKGLRGILVLLCFTFLFRMLYTPGDAVASVWIFTITKQGIWKAVQMTATIALMITGASLLSYTSTPKELEDGLEKAFSGLGKIGVPVHEMAVIVMIAFRFIPIMLEETDKQRAEYYYKNTGKTWGDVNNYHMILNTSDLGIENCADILMRYFEMKDYI